MGRSPEPPGLPKLRQLPQRVLVPPRMRNQRCSSQGPGAGPHAAEGRPYPPPTAPSSGLTLGRPAASSVRPTLQREANTSGFGSQRPTGRKSDSRGPPPLWLHCPLDSLGDTETSLHLFLSSPSAAQEEQQEAEEWGRQHFPTSQRPASDEGQCPALLGSWASLKSKVLSTIKNLELKSLLRSGTWLEQTNKQTDLPWPLGGMLGCWAGDKGR